jgi:hypothetical protein
MVNARRHPNLSDACSGPVPLTHVNDRRPEGVKKCGFMRCTFADARGALQMVRA